MVFSACRSVSSKRFQLPNKLLNLLLRQIPLRKRDNLFQRHTGKPAQHRVTEQLRITPAQLRARLRAAQNLPYCDFIVSQVDALPLPVSQNGPFTQELLHSMRKEKKG